MSQVALHEFQPNLWLTELQLPEFDVRGAVLLGGRRSLVWDTLSHPRDMAPVAGLMAGRPPTIVYSHADWDHVWGTEGFPDRDEVVGHVACLARFAEDVPATLERKRAERPDLWAGVTLIPPTRTFVSELSIDLGDLSLVLHHLPGHTPDCCVGFIPERGVLLMGDTVETPFPVVNDADALLAWIARLEIWAADERVHTVIPAHGAIGGREIIDRNILYLSALVAGTEPELSTELTPFYRQTHAANRDRAGRRS